MILAKDIQKFKSLRGRGPELHLELILLYFFCDFDNQIVLTTDKKSLQNPVWEEVKKYFSNSGKVLQSLKKLKEHIELNKVENVHFGQILKLQKEMQQQQ